MSIIILPLLRTFQIDRSCWGPQTFYVVLSRGDLKLKTKSQFLKLNEKTFEENKVKRRLKFSRKFLTTKAYLPESSRNYLSTSSILNIPFVLQASVFRLQKTKAYFLKSIKNYLSATSLINIPSVLKHFALMCICDESIHSHCTLWSCCWETLLASSVLGIFNTLCCSTCTVSEIENKSSIIYCTVSSWSLELFWPSTVQEIFNLRNSAFLAIFWT